MTYLLSTKILGGKKSGSPMCLRRTLSKNGLKYFEKGRLQLFVFIVIGHQKPRLPMCLLSSTRNDCSFSVLLVSRYKPSNDLPRNIQFKFIILIEIRITPDSSRQG